jgi:hypothetical protein
MVWLVAGEAGGSGSQGIGRVTRMADFATTTRSVTARTGEGDNIVPAWVLVAKRRERAERRKRALGTILGQAEVAGN